MSVLKRVLVLMLALLLLTGCSEYSFGGNKSETATINDRTEVRTLQYLDNSTEGPLYELTFTVPERWVGQFETLNRGNSLLFRYLENDDDENGSPFFYIEALSNAQYWEQIGSYPQQYVNINNTADTYFIHDVPTFAHYSGIPDDEFDSYVAEIDELVNSISIALVEED